MRPTIGIMPSGLPWVLKPVKGDDNLFGSLLTSRYKKRQPYDKLDDNLGYAERYHQYMFSVPYSDHSCFAEIQEFIELVQPTNIQGIVSSSSCYVDPLYYFSRLCGVNQPPKRFVYKNERKEGGKKEVVVSYFESGDSPEAGRKKSRPVGVGYKRVGVSRVSASRRVRRGAKIVESDFRLKVLTFVIGWAKYIDLNSSSILLIQNLWDFVCLCTPYRYLNSLN